LTKGVENDASVGPLNLPLTSRDLDFDLLTPKVHRFMPYTLYC